MNGKPVVDVAIIGAGPGGLAALANCAGNGCF